MPELPEVQTVVTTLAPKVLGRRITAVRLLRTDIVAPTGVDLPSKLTGRRITDLTRRGKRIVFTLDDNNRFYIHLGMTGRLTFDSPKTPNPPHTHLKLPLNADGEIRFRDPRRFGGVFWLGQDSPDGNMGPEPLTLTLADFIPALKKTKRPIKNALMDQRVIAGLGNIYVDESLHAAGIHPLALSHRLKPNQVRTLLESIQQILNRAIRARGSTLRDYVDADGQPGEAHLLHVVYDRADDPCQTCKTPIKRIVLGGRSTHFCPKCQPRRAR